MACPYIFLDIDQCSVNNGGCEQTCINLLPGFVCSCYNGFILNSDGISCSGIYRQAVLDICTF